MSNITVHYYANECISHSYSIVKCIHLQAFKPQLAWYLLALNYSTNVSEANCCYTVICAFFFYGAKSQQANSNIAKQKRSQTATWLEIPKAPLDLPITCLLPWRHGMRTHSQRRVPGKRRGWLKCEASSDLLLLQSVTTAAVLALLAVPCSITKAKKIEYLSQPCVILK